ncbi:YncE family protein [Microbacter margulisiae]|uniref:DNA-binding beta-propeller fold protein YncE n=1 Tax=Microbacter margulisiae TaxID=1350067 RepID=A0A7W5DQY6_9PORP|nr:YncE family protein [Microbacter margulisiae]MBB3187088.1 DNA-binding beta-propeller fold protein YncE [Microbacter margulisiae]
MRQKNAFFLVLTMLFAVLVSSCSTNDPTNSGTIVQSAQSIYVLNQGTMNQDNSTLTMYNLSNETATTDWFNTQNGKGLGDTGNDMAIYGGKIYIVMNVSSYVEVTDLQGHELKQIPLFNGTVAREPREIAFYQNKAYVCSFDSTVARIDTSTLSVDAITKAGSNPDGICAIDGKLYVSNSGGLNYPNYSNTVSVIDIPTFTQTKTITVVTNPYLLKTGSDGKVYLLSHGNYGSISGAIQQIDPTTDAVTQTYSNSEAVDFALNGTKLYYCNFDYSTMQSSVKVMDLTTGTSTDFITDGTSIPLAAGIAVDAATGNVYVASSAADYVSDGTIYCFDSTGKKLFSFTTGVNPWKMVFVR